MPQVPNEQNCRVAFRVRAEDKALLLRAVELEQTDLTAFIVRIALREARSVIADHERLRLSQRDSELVLDLLENPPLPNARLRKAARALPDTR